MLVELLLALKYTIDSELIGREEKLPVVMGSSIAFKDEHTLEVKRIVGP